MPDEKTPEALFRRLINSSGASDWIRNFVQEHAKPTGAFEVSEEHIRSLHSRCMVGLLERPGLYRQHDLKSLGEPGKPKHKPPDWQTVPTLMKEFVQNINSMWSRANEFEIGAFAMWKLNWIHPFENGNGRTSRVFSYFLMNMKAGHLFPGTVGSLLPDQIGGKKGRPQYIKALRSADSGNLQPLYDLLSKALKNQLSDALHKDGTK